MDLIPERIILTALLLVLLALAFAQLEQSLSTLKPWMLKVIHYTIVIAGPIGIGATLYLLWVF